MSSCVLVDIHINILLRTSCWDKCALISSTASLYWLCHQRQTSDSLHAAGQAVLPVQDMEICGVHSVWVLHPDHDRHQHSGPHDEGKKWIFYVITVNHLLKSLFLKVHQGCRQTQSHSITQTEVQQCWLLHMKCAWIFSYEYVVSNFGLLKACFTDLLNIWVSAEWVTISPCFFFFCSSMMLLIRMRTCWSGWTSSSRLSSHWSAFSRSLPSALWWEWKDSNIT